MEETEIKQEFDFDSISHCECCLSVGRKLLPLKELSDVYRRLTSDILYANDHGECIGICWECSALLRRAHQFRCQVKKSNDLLQLRQTFRYGTLSNLTSAVFNDTHPNIIYIYESNIQRSDKTVSLNTQRNKSKEHDDSFNGDDKSLNDCNKSFYDSDKSFNDCNNSFNDNDNSNDDNDKSNYANDKSNDDNDKSNDDKTLKKPRNSNKWAKIKALQNKKPKFRILSEKEIVYDETFVRVAVDGGVVQQIVGEREDDSNRCNGGSFIDECCGERLVEDTSTDNLQISTCDVCKKCFSDKHHLTRHMKIHRTGYQCVLCQCITADKYSHIEHYRKQHSRLYQCLRCQLKLTSRRDFFKHYKEWHEKFICDYCGISFKMRYCIKNHIRKQHSPFECRPCNKTFARYNGLWLHNKTKHTTAQAAYCVECDKQYPDVYRYRWHLANSTRHTPRQKVRVPCPACDKVFTKNIYMRDHYNLVHLKFFKYRCEDCDKNFIRNADLLKHKRRVHEGILPPKNKMCYLCGRGFASNKILNNHVRTHTRERPFSCSRCNASFAQNTALVAHTRALHTD